MQLYFYCSYTNASRGFYLTRLEGGQLVPASLSPEGGEGAADEFFSYDRFRFLWQEFPQSASLLPAPAQGILGVRGLEGKFSDRDGTVNFVLLCPREELEVLQRLALGMLSDLDGFVRELLPCLSIGGPCGYQADATQLEEVFRTACGRWERGAQLAGSAVPLSGTRPLSARELLHLAVYTGSWKQASEHLQPAWLWKLRPRQCVSQEEFSRWFSCTALAPQAGGTISLESE